MTRHFDYCPSASEGDNQSVRSSAPVVSRCFPGGYNVKLYISRGRLAWWLLAFLHSDIILVKDLRSYTSPKYFSQLIIKIANTMQCMSCPGKFKGNFIQPLMNKTIYVCMSVRKPPIQLTSLSCKMVT